MRTTTLASAAAIALAAGIGSVSAADQVTTLNWVQKLTTLNGVKAVPMSSGELSAVKGMALEYFRILPPSEGNYPGNDVGSDYLNPNTPPQADPLDFCGANIDSCARIETNHHQAEIEATTPGAGNYVVVEVEVDGVLRTFTISPSYLGLRHAGCNGVIVFPYPGNSDISEFCP